MIRPRTADMITIASRLTGVSEADILSGRRFIHLCAVRHPICVTAREWGYSYPAIGAAIGRRDHSTVINSCASRERLVPYIKDFAEYCEAVSRWADELPPFVKETDWRPDRVFKVVLSLKAREAESVRRKENSRLARSKLRVDYDMEVSARIAGEIKVGSANLLAALQAAA